MTAKGYPTHYQLSALIIYHRLSSVLLDPVNRPVVDFFRASLYFRTELVLLQYEEPVEFKDRLIFYATFTREMSRHVIQIAVHTVSLDG